MTDENPSLTAYAIIAACSLAAALGVGWVVSRVMSGFGDAIGKLGGEQT